MNIRVLFYLLLLFICTLVPRIFIPSYPYILVPRFSPPRTPMPSYRRYSSPCTPDIRTLAPQICIPCTPDMYTLVYPGYLSPRTPDIYTHTPRIFISLYPGLYTFVPRIFIPRSSFWNFDTLFQPQQHPARDMHDT